MFREFHRIQQNKHFYLNDSNLILWKAERYLLRLSCEAFIEPFKMGSEGGAINLSAAEAILDLEQLELLQEQAERMKGLGNKHMANQVRWF